MTSAGQIKIEPEALTAMVRKLEGYSGTIMDANGVFRNNVEAVDWATAAQGSREAFEVARLEWQKASDAMAELIRDIARRALAGADGILGTDDDLAKLFR